MILNLIFIVILIENCFSMQIDSNDDEWIEISYSTYTPPEITSKPRSMSGGGGRIQFIQSIQHQQRMRQRAYTIQHNNSSATIPTDVLEDNEQIYYDLNKKLKAYTIQLDAEGIDENTQKELKKNILDLKLELNKYKLIKVQEILKGRLSEASRNHFIITNNMLYAQQEMLQLEYSLLIEQFNPYVQTLLNKQHIAKQEEIKGAENLLEKTRERTSSEEVLIAENQVLRIQNEILTIDNTLATRQFNEYVKVLVRTYYTRKSAEVRDLDIQAKKFEIIEINEALQHNELDDAKRKIFEIKLSRQRWYVKKFELSRIEETLNTTIFLSQSEDEYLSLEADILRKQIRIIEIEEYLTTQNIPANEENPFITELKSLINELNFLEKRKQYIHIKWQLKNKELIKSEQIRLETNFAFLQAEVLMHKKSKEEFEELLHIFDSYKNVYKEMERIEGIFRKNQGISQSIGNHHELGYPLRNHIKYQLSKKYQELYNEIRKYTIIHFINRENIINKLKECMHEKSHATDLFSLNDEQSCLFGVREIIDQHAFDQFLEREQLPPKIISEMRIELSGAKKRYSFIKQPAEFYELVEDQTRSIYDYGLQESYLLSEDQRCELGIEYLKLMGLDPINIEFLESEESA